MFLGVPCLALALLAFGQELFKVLRRATGAANPRETTSAIEPAVIRRCAVSIVAWTLGFFSTSGLTVVIAVPVASFLYFRFAGGEKWAASISLSFAAGGFFTDSSTISSICLFLKERCWSG